MEPKFCPILKAAGFCNGKEICSVECAWWSNGCAIVCSDNSTDYIGDTLEEIVGELNSITSALKGLV